MNKKKFKAYILTLTEKILLLEDRVKALEARGQVPGAPVPVPNFGTGSPYLPPYQVTCTAGTLPKAPATGGSNREGISKFMEDCCNGGPVTNIFEQGYFAAIDHISEKAPVQTFPADPGRQLGSSPKDVRKTMGDLKDAWFPKQTLPDPTEAQQADKTFMAWLEQQRDEAAKTMEEQMVEGVLGGEAAVSVPVLTPEQAKYAEIVDKGNGGYEIKGKDLTGFTVSDPDLFEETSTTEADKAHAEWLARNRGQMPAHSDPFEENPSSQVV